MTKHERRFVPTLFGTVGLLALLLVAGSVPVHGQDAAAADEEGISIQFPNADINTAILTEYERLTGRKVIRDNAIIGATISIETSGELPRARAAEFIEKTLLLNGYALLPTEDEDVYKIIAYDAGKQVRSEGTPVIVKPEDLPDSDIPVTYIMPLSHLAPEKAADTFSQIMPSHPYGAIVPLENAAAVVVTDSTSVIRSMLELRDQIDVPPSELEERAFQLTRADAEEVAEQLSEILGLDSSESGGGGASRRVTTPQPNQPVANNNAAGAAQNNAPRMTTGGSGVGPAPSATEPKIVPLPNTNRILVVARPVDMAYIENLIEEIDSPAEIADKLERRLNYMSVAHFLEIAENTLTRGLAVAQTSSQISGGQGSGLQNNTFGSSRTSSGFGGSSGFGSSSRFGGSGSSFGGGGFGSGSSGFGGSDLGNAGQEMDIGPQSLVVGKTLLIADNVHNNLIVYGPPENLEIIDELIETLDVRAEQIQISVIIAQLTLGDDFDFGFDLLRTLETVGPDGRRLNGAGVLKSRTGDAQSILDIDTLDVVENFLPAAQGLTFYGQINPYFNAYLSMLQSTRRFKVLQRPTVYTVNNKQAVIETGQRVAVPRSTQSSLDPDANVTNQIVTASIDYEEVVLRIQVVPLINDAGEITLRIQQLNDNIVGSTIVGGDEIPTIGTQSLGTTVMVPDGSTVLLGGLISEETNKSESGLPTFTNLPLLGKVFGSESRSNSRQELLIFIQPKIIESWQDQEAIDADMKTRTTLAEEAEDFAADKPSVKVAPPEKPKKGWFRNLFSRGD